MATPGTRSTIGRLLERRAAERPDATYLFYEDVEHTYRDTHERARRVARGLAAAGFSPGDRLAILLPNGPEFLWIWFGAALAGVVVVPINPAFKRDEVAYILENSGARAFVTTAERVPDMQPALAARPALAACYVVGETAPAGPWRAFASLLDAPDGDDELPEVAPEDDAAIIYTSGTTGHPKGVVLSHHNYIFDTWSIAEHLRTSDEDRFLCFLPLFHVNAQVVSVLSALHAGGALILLAEFKPQTFFETLARYRATTFSAVPTVYAILNTLPDADAYDLSSLRYCVCGAAPMPVEVFRTFERTFGATIVEGYGLSEATCGTCINPVGSEETRKIGSIGVPLPGIEMAILDDAGNARPDGEMGEIAVRGEVVMKEYFGNPEATRAALVDGWLRTGDLGYRDTDGYFFIVGRKKEMIIRGGENIYPKEIEEVIYQHPDVQEAAVIGVPDDVWGEIVCACVVARPDRTPTPEEIRAHCADHLADFKVPARVALLEALPKTATGKIQKSRIQLP